MNLKNEKQWMEQADYDMHAADKMFEAGVYPYTIFMCQLSIEKALKGIYTAKLQEEPPKIHNLLKLSSLSGLKLPDDIDEILTTLNNASVSSRYPEDIKSVLKHYGKDRTKTILEDSRRALEWLKKQYEEK
jgi:HEPN domain-containing protein